MNSIIPVYMKEKGKGMTVNEICHVMHISWSMTLLSPLHLSLDNEKYFSLSYFLNVQLFSWSTNHPSTWRCTTNYSTFFFLRVMINYRGRNENRKLDVKKMSVRRDLLKQLKELRTRCAFFQLNILFAHVTYFRWYNVLILPKYDSNICREQVRK